MKYLLVCGMSILFATPLCGQGCGVSGSLVPEAVLVDPVCGPLVFEKDSVPACSNGFALPPVCSADGTSYTNKNPNWYHFFCLKTGTLGFMITPENNLDDYNWLLLDVTGHSWRADVLNNPSNVVGGNWSGKGGKTGASADGKSSLVCPVTNPPYASPFSKMPHLKEKHSYLLLVSHHRGLVQNGYTLSFGGGTAMIADTTTDYLKEAKAACDGKSITVFLNTDTISIIPPRVHLKGIKPGSLALDGSDFKLLHTSVDILSASSQSTSAIISKLTLQLDGQLKPGAYTLVLQKGNDGNTLVDKCGKGIHEGETLDFFKQNVPPVPMRNVLPLGCASKSIQVVFAGKIKCNSIAADGSDFSIVNRSTGRHLPISGAKVMNCKNNLSDTVRIYLAEPIQKKGTFQLILKKGTDGNTTISRCDVSDPPNQSITFISPGGASAMINPHLQYACNKVKVTLSNPGKNRVNSWNWSSSSGKTSYRSSFSFTDTSFKTQTIKLRVSNGACSAEDSIQLHFNKDYYVHADLTLPSFVCSQDPVKITNKSKGGHITHWDWSFGNGKYSHQKNPRIQHYPVTTFTKKYPVKLTITNSKGCKDIATKAIKVLNTCDVYVPTAFTPNDDGKNDELHPLNAFLTKHLSFKVYNRFGEMVFQTTDWTDGWDGTFHGKPQPEGSYIWVLRFVNAKTGKKVFRKGAALLVR